MKDIVQLLKDNILWHIKTNQDFTLSTDDAGTIIDYYEGLQLSNEKIANIAYEMYPDLITEEGEEDDMNEERKLSRLGVIRGLKYLRDKAQ